MINLEYLIIYDCFLDFPGASDGKASVKMWETQVQSLGWENPWRRKWQPTPKHSTFFFFLSMCTKKK